MCVCGDTFDVDYAMVCRHEIRDLEADLLNLVCNEIEPVFQNERGEVLTRDTNIVPDARLDVYAHGFWERQGSAFFDLRVCHPNAVSYKDLTPKQI